VRFKPAGHQPSHLIGYGLAITVIALLLQFGATLVWQYVEQQQAYHWLRQQGARIETIAGQGLAVELQLAPDQFDTAIATLRKLDETVYRLDLSNIAIADIQVLALLPELHVLDLSYTAVSDLSPLLALKQLQVLNLRMTPVSDVSALADLAALQALDLGFTDVKDLRPLAALQRLQVLSLRNVPALHIEPLAALTALRSLDLGYMYVIDIRPLTVLPTLQLLNLSGTAVSDVIMLVQLPTLLHLYLLDTPAARTGQVEQLRRGMPQLSVWVTQG